MELVWIIALSIFIGAFPFDYFIPWIIQRFESILAKLDREVSPVSVSNAPIGFALAQGFLFLKGFLLPYYLFHYLRHDWVIVLSVALLFISHVWSPFRKFKTYGQFQLLIWGVLSAVFFPFSYLYPLMLISFSVLLNSYYFSSVLSILMIFFWISFYGLEPFYLGLNFVLFTLVFLVLGNAIFTHFEKTPQTLLTQFKNR